MMDRKAITFLFRFPEILCLFPQIQNLLCVDNQMWSFFETKEDERRYTVYTKNRLCVLLNSLGYTDQKLNQEIWSFQNPETKQTYEYYMKIGQKFEDTPDSVRSKMKEADTFISDMVVNQNIRHLIPNVKHFIGASDSNFEPDQDDHDDYGYQIFTEFIWQNPEYFETYTSFEYPKDFPYHLNRITSEYMKENVKTQTHSSLKDLSEYYRGVGN